MHKQTLRAAVLTLLLAGGTFFVACGQQALAAPSFDCSRATAADEVAICSDPELSKLDSLIADAYQTYQPDYQPKEEVGRLLLRDRASCGSDKLCIATAQWNALQTFGGDAPWAQAMAVDGIAKRAALASEDASAFSKEPPTKPAECRKTHMMDITTRFGNPLTPDNTDQGISITYDNGSFVYSYERGHAFDGIISGQAAVLCLITVPYDCPAGDVRGRVYYTLNLATKRSWVSSDTEHGCGGA
ncbi:lysozyme inhibitor LprI family protein [Aestuariivirga sp.]|uniref:lysozyme inhibitor LprI family protein n=1 Tax=Aestuariivirga sp. TaxID=2650926 RepID=UPI003BA965C2